VGEVGSAFGSAKHTGRDEELDMLADTGGFFDGPFEHYEATPEGIETSAVELDRSYGIVEILTSDVDAAHRPALSGVAGDITAPMAAAPELLRGNNRQVMTAAMVAAGSVRVFGHAVHEFNEGVDALNAQWQEAAGSDFGVAAASYPTDANALQKTRVDEARADAVLDAKVALLTELKLKYDELKAKLDADADRSASQLHEGPSDENILKLFAAGGLPSTIVGAFPHLQFSMKRLPPDLASMSDDELADYALAHPELGASLLPLLDQQVKQLIGRELAERGKGLGNQFDDRQEGFQSDIDTFTEGLAAYGGDAVVATSFLNELGPRGLIELNGRIASAQLDTNDLPPGHPDRAALDADYARSVSRLQMTLGEVLAAGTSGQPTHQHWTGEGDETYVSEQWVNDLLAESEKQVELVAPGTNRSGEVYGYQLLSPLLANGDHSSQFLSRVGASMLQFEQDYEDEHGHLPWMDQTDGGVPVEGVRLDWTSGWDDQKDPAGWDPMTGLMRALANDPDASRDFFTGEITDPGSEDQRYPRLDYLLTDRHWAGDAPWLGQDAAPVPLGSSSLGEALKAATLEDADTRSVDLVEAIVREYSIDEEAIGYNDGENLEEAEKAKRFYENTLIDPELVPAMRDIATNYIGSFNLELSENRVPGAVPDYLFDDARFDDLDAQRFLAELGKDPTSAGQISAASRAYAAYDLQHRLADAAPDAYSDLIRNASSSTGMVTGAVDFGAVSGIRADIEFQDAQFNEGVQRGFQALGVLKSTLTGLPPAVSSGMTHLLGIYEDSMLHDHAGQANADTGVLLQNGEGTQAEFFRNAVWRNIPADELPEGFKPGVDPEVQLEQNPDLEQVYNDWLEHGEGGKYADAMRDLDAKQHYRNGHEDAQSKLEHN
jgi:hypothetical protein